MRGIGRRIVGLVVVFMLSLVFVSAELIVNGPEQASINIGDDIFINGYVLRGTDVLGLLKFELKCAGQSSVLSTKTVSLKAGVKKDFSEVFAITSLNEETCSVKVLLESEGNVLESKTSSLFKVTKELTGTFTINGETVQAGESVGVVGTVFKQNGIPLEGSAIISLKKEGDVYLTDTIIVKKGVLDYDIDTIDLPGGSYVVEVNARDNFGNNIILTVGRFSLVNKIEVNAHSVKVHYFPKEKVKVTGTANTISGKLKNGVAFLDIDGQKYEEGLNGGNFDFSFFLLNTITSGKHDVNIRVEDENGNYGTYGFSIIVDAIPSKVVVAVDAESINPGGKISVKAFLNDQAGDLIEDDLIVKVVNGKGDVMYDSIKKSGEQFEIAIGEDVVPGNYYVMANYDNVEGERIFAVGKVVKLEYNMEGQVLVVKNIGNVPYEGPLQIDVDGSESSSSISKKINLGLGQESKIDIGKEVVTGKYKVTVNGNMFEDVSVVGNKGIGYKWLIYLVIAWILILLFYMFKGNKRRLNFKINHAIKHSGVVHSNRKHGEFGGASMSRVKDEEDHVKKYKDYMTRVGSFGKKKKLDRKKGTFFSFVNKGEKRKVENVNENLDVDNVYSGVKSNWVREDSKDEFLDVERAEKKKKDDEKSSDNIFGLFDM